MEVVSIAKLIFIKTDIPSPEKMLQIYTIYNVYTYICARAHICMCVCMSVQDLIYNLYAIFERIY